MMPFVDRTSWSPGSDCRRAKGLSRPLLGSIAVGTLLTIVALVVDSVASPALYLAMRSERPVARADVRSENEQLIPRRAPRLRALTQEATPKMATGNRPAHPWLGIHARDVVFPADYPLALACEGAMIVHVLPGGPADVAGLHGASFEEPRDNSPISEPGDVILAIDRLGVTSVDDLAYDLDLPGKRVGDTVRLRVVRKTEILEVSVKLTARVEGQVGAS